VAVLTAACAVAALGATAGAASAAPKASSSAARTRADASSNIAGFTPAHSAWEQQYEKAFAALPTPALARQYTYGLTSYPGLVATSGDKRRVNYTVRLLRSFGLDPIVKTYYTYLSVPKKVSVTMVKPFRFHAANKENRAPGERDYADMVVGYNALSPSGNVTAPAVYVNYGTPADYAELAKLGVSVKGKIAISRYGANFRGVKVHEAQIHGAVGSVIYSDPQQDGYTQGPVFPKGPWRPADGIQRGSIQYLWEYPGDPLTPGHASTKNAPRIAPSKAADLPRLPSTPISYGSAKPMLANLGGPVAPASWQGGLPFTYHVGGQRVKIHLDLDIHFQTKPIWDVLVRIPGSTHPGQQIMLGAHRDAWTYGSDDNGSGAVNVLQIARSLGMLLKQGWRPDRTITLALWDGEEYGLYGSTEYAEQQGAGLDHTVAYLNMDIAGGKYFGASAVPSLDNLVRQVAAQVPWPGYTNLYAAWSAESGGGTPQLDRLGSGSDYTAYLDRYGVPSADIGGGTPSGNYHCSCDNVYMESHFIDPTWQYHVGVTRAIGLVMLRLANADVPELNYADYAKAVKSYLADVPTIEQQVYGRQVLDLTHVNNVVAQWQQAASALNNRTDSLLARGSGTAAQFRTITTALLADERALLTSAGVPGRTWYRHQIYAPGTTTGYAAEYLPALTDALNSGNIPLARAYLSYLVGSLQQATALLRAALAQSATS
jgi:N-acetylated-alpha-linked acidic dipeptidase